MSIFDNDIPALDWPDVGLVKLVGPAPYGHCRHYLRTVAELTTATRNCNKYHMTKEEADACKGQRFGDR